MKVLYFAWSDGYIQSMTLTETNWMNEALCRSSSTENIGCNWFADADTIACKRAITVCKECPVANQCLQAALDNEESFGVWGGMTPAQRHALSMGVSREQALRIQRTYSRHNY